MTVEDRVARALEVYTLEEILEMNDLPVDELLARLVEDGTIQLPEVEPL